MTVAVRFDAVSKAYPSQTVLREFSLDVHQGEFFGLVGVNGAGKTTAMKCLLDFVRPARGTISVFGLSSLETRARARVAYLPERFLPPYHLTGSAFLGYIGRLYGVALSSQRIEQACAAVDLDVAALNRTARTYSKGMAQKLGLVGCFLSDRDLLVLDEPMSGLDPKARVLVKRKLHDLKRNGTTVVFSTHMLFDVEELCDRMGVLDEGWLKFVGAPGECTERFAAATLEEAYLACIERGAPKGA
ncbi:MAG: ABC-2 type transport system ATP-binding protein [Gammaproteobacteria bacterium]|jgi:ABC-2 type transport system ATP-binding protein